MALLGNILLVIAGLLFAALAGMLFGKAPSGSGDSLMGYAWGMIILNLAFSVCMALVYIIIGAKGGFDWVGSTKASRFWLVSLVLLSALVTSALSGLFKYEHGPVPGLLRLYSSFAPALIPVLLIGSGVILLNDGIRASVSPALFKSPLIIAGILGITGSVSALAGMLAETSRNQRAKMEADARFEDENHTRILNDIDSCDVHKNLVMILVFTGDNQPEDIHQRAVDKVKTHPQWQHELIRLLGTDWAPEVFQFLASNPVDSTALFTEPVREGLKIQARLIRETIRNASHPSHFYQGQFTWEVERVIRTVDRFQNQGINYLSEMKEIRSAFDEPSPFDKPKWPAVTLMDAWIRSHS